MMLTRLSLANMRNYSALEFAPSPGLNLLVGANAQGKSNLLEAISLLGTGKSFRTSREGELISDGSNSATISGEALLRSGSVRLACTLAAAGSGMRKAYSVNGRSVRYIGFLGSIKVVTFSPSDLNVVTGPPAVRRSFINMALSVQEPAYYRHLARYRNALSQKVALFGSGTAPDPDLVQIYNAALVEHGTAIMCSRFEYVAQLNAAAQVVHQEWVAGTETFEVRYAPSVAVEPTTFENVAGAFRQRLEQTGKLEAARKVVLTGPHRDDVRLLGNGRALSAFGSQGQQRTAVLALKVAEYLLLQRRCAETPLLLLDDVLSELDSERAAAFLKRVGTYEQAFMTATQAPAGIRAGACYSVDAATLQRVA